MQIAAQRRKTKSITSRRGSRSRSSSRSSSSRSSSSSSSSSRSSTLLLVPLLEESSLWAKQSTAWASGNHFPKTKVSPMPLWYTNAIIFHRLLSFHNPCVKLQVQSVIRWKHDNPQPVQTVIRVMIKDCVWWGQIVLIFYCMSHVKVNLVGVLNPNETVKYAQVRLDHCFTPGIQV